MLWVPADCCCERLGFGRAWRLWNLAGVELIFQIQIFRHNKPCGKFYRISLLNA